MNILLIDDDPASCDRLVAFFQTKGYPFVQTADGKTARALVLQHPISIIISSQETQDMDGIELCRHIRDGVKNNYIYFIQVAKKTEKEKRLTGYYQGVDAYITNPPELEELAALIQVGLRIAGFNPLHSARKEPERAHPSTRPNVDKQDTIRKLSLKKPPLQTKGKDICKYDILFARIALEQKLITKKILTDMFNIQKKEKISGNIISIDDIILEKKIISPNKIDDLRRTVKWHFGRKFGTIALNKGFATPEQVNKALKEQAAEFKDSQTYRRTGDILVANMAITKEQCDLIRCEMKPVKSFHGVKPSIENSIAPRLEPNNQNTEQKGRSIEDMITLVVCANKLEASIRLKTDNSDKITPGDIIEVLNKKNIIYGVASLEQITVFLNTDVNEEKTFLVAKGKPATLGCDASIEYHFDTDHLKAGTINEEGNIDYRERGESPRVQRDDLLATKTCMKRGEPGIDVYGNPILVPDTNDAHLKCGQGTLVSDNGLEVYAAIDGQPNLTVAGELSVFAELIINGDVNFNTGNIDFDGNVVVKGAIIEGFTIKCGNLNAKEVFGAKIFAIGDVSISGGIIRTQIKAEGNVTAKFITNSNIKSFGSIMVDKEVVDSKIRSSGNFIATRGKIVSSFISAKMGFESAKVGSDVSGPCRIHVGRDENIKKRIQEFNHTINDKKIILEALQKNYEKASKRQETIHLKISELAQLQESQISVQQSLKRHIEKLKQRGRSDEILPIETKRLALKTNTDTSENQLNKYFKTQEILDDKITIDSENIKKIIREIESISDEKDALIKWSKEEMGIPIIKVEGSISQGTKIFGIYSSIIPKETLRNVFIKEIEKPDADRWEMVISECK
jgi:uncharacterized protein (DUF342 family)/DNA-binding NarL/FixJ family response regulator